MWTSGAQSGSRQLSLSPSAWDSDGWDGAWKGRGSRPAASLEALSLPAHDLCGVRPAPAPGLGVLVPPAPAQPSPLPSALCPLLFCSCFAPQKTDRALLGPEGQCVTGGAVSPSPPPLTSRRLGVLRSGASHRPPPAQAGPRFWSCRGSPVTSHGLTYPVRRVWLESQGQNMQGLAKAPGPSTLSTGCHFFFLRERRCASWEATRRCGSDPAGRAPTGGLGQGDIGLKAVCPPT